MINGVVSSTEEGTLQGGLLIPLLSNIVLDELDKEIREARTQIRSIRRRLQHLCEKQTCRGAYNGKCTAIY